VSARTPGALLFHPLAIASLLILVFNDHYLKAAWPSPLSGKLSDFAGVFLAPVVAFSAFELVVARFWARPLSRRRTNAVAALLAGAIAIGFSLPEVWEPAERAYRYGLAALQLPFRAVISLVASGAWPEFRPVVATADVTDLLALPMAFVAYRVMALPEPAPRSRRSRLVAPAACAVVALLGFEGPCAAETTNRATSKGAAARKHREYRHDGFFGEAALGGGLLFVDSAASISNGFRQGIPSSATGASAPVLSFAAGGTLPQGFVLGLRVNVGGASQPAISTLGERFSVHYHNLEFVLASPFVRYYPDPTNGLFFGAGVAYLTLQASDGEQVFDSTVPIGEQQNGFAGVDEGGHGLWISKQFSLSASLQIAAGRVSGEHGGSFVFAPHLFGGLTWH
jgi:hypothetical protein